MMNKKSAFVCNKMMSELLQSEHEKELGRRLIHQIEKNAHYDLKNMKDYGHYVVQKRNHKEKQPLSELIARHGGNLSYYEWDCNETYIPVDPETDCISKAALFLLDYLKESLSRRFPGKSFCIIISLSTEEIPGITAHYYQNRSGIVCFDHELDKYTQPVLYEYI